MWTKWLSILVREHVVNTKQNLSRVCSKVPCLAAAVRCYSAQVVQRFDTAFVCYPMHRLVPQKSCVRTHKFSIHVLFWPTCCQSQWTLWSWSRCKWKQEQKECQRHSLADAVVTIALHAQQSLMQQTYFNNNNMQVFYAFPAETGSKRLTNY